MIWTRNVSFCSCLESTPHATAEDVTLDVIGSEESDDALWLIMGAL